MRTETIRIAIVILAVFAALLAAPVAWNDKAGNEVVFSVIAADRTPAAVS